MDELSNGAANGRPLRVVLGESDPMAAQGLAESLKSRWGEMDITFAPSGRAFWAALNAQAFDLVIAESRVHGHEADELVGALNARRVRGPVVLLTDEDAEAARVAAIGRPDILPVVKTSRYAELLPALVGTLLARQREIALNDKLLNELKSRDESVCALIAGSDEAAVLVTGGLIAEANPAFCRLLDLRPDDGPLGLPLAHFLGAEEAAFFLETPLETAPTESRRVLLTGAQGRPLWVEVQASALAYRGKPTRRLAFRPLPQGDEEGSADLLRRLRRAAAQAHEALKAPTPALAAEALLGVFARALGVEGGSLYLRRGQSLQRQATLEAPHQPPTLSLPLVPGSVLDRAFAQGKPVYVQNHVPKQSLATPAWDGYRDDALMVVTINDAKGELLGLISLHNKNVPPFTPLDLQLASLLTAQAQTLLRLHGLSAELQDHATQTGKLADCALSGVAVVRQGKVVYANASLAELLGFDPKEAVMLAGRPYQSFLAPELRERASEELKRLFLNDEAVYRGRLTLQGRDGLRVQTAISACCGRHEGQLSLIVQAAAETSPDGAKALDLAGSDDSLSSQILSQLLENVSDWVTMVNRQGRIFFVTPSVRTLLGLEAEQVIGKRLEDVYGACLWRDGVSASDPFADLLTANARARLSFRALDGQKLDVAVTTRALKSRDGVALGYMLVARDRSTEERLARSLVAVQKNEALGLLATGVVHDFNNLLTAFGGYLHLAQQSSEDPERLSGFLDQIENTLGQATSLTKRLLTIARREGQDTGEAVQIDQVLKELEPLLRHMLGARFVLNFAPKAKARVAMPAASLTQILINLVVNAKDALREVRAGQVSVECENFNPEESPRRQAAPLPPGEWVRLSVADNGCGIDPTVLPRIFEPFFTTKSEGQGTGLGLATVRAIVTQQRGVIEVDSALGRGTRFDLYLPVVP